MKSTKYLPALKQFNQVQKRASPGERVIGSLFPNRGSGYPGSWAQSREQVLHYKNWTYVAVHTICSKMASIMPNMAYVVDHAMPGLTTKAWQRGLMNMNGNGFGGSSMISDGGHSFLTIGEYRSKALSVVKPHEELEPLESEHPLRRLLENPNPCDTSFDLLYESQMFQELCGVSYLWLVPNAFGVPCEIWVIPSHWVWPRTGGGKYIAPETLENDQHADELIQYYEVRPFDGMGSAGYLKLPPNEVIMERWKSPVSKISGYSKLSAIAEWIDSEEAISKSRWAQFDNQARPELWIELGAGYEDPDDAKIARIEAKFMRKAQGILNYGKPIITPPGAKVTPLSFSPTEMAYFQSEDQIRSMILSAFQVPESAVGISAGMTYGSVLATLAQMCTFCVNPRLSMRGQSLSKHLAHRWSKPGKRVRIWWDDTVPADPAQINSDLSTDGGQYAVTPNEIRALRGRKPYKHGGDDPLVTGPGGIQPLPINTGDDLGDLAKLIEPITQMGQEGGEEQPGQEGEGGQEQEGDGTSGGPNSLATEPGDSDASVDEPNGEPEDYSNVLAKPKSITKAPKPVVHVVEMWYIRNGFSLAEAKEMAAEDVAGIERDVDNKYPGLNPAARGAQVARIVRERHKGGNYKPNRITKTEGPHSYHSTQVQIEDSGVLADWKMIQSEIDPTHVASKGLETDPHITTLYGLHDNDIGELRRAVETFGPITAKLGKTKVFPAKQEDVQAGGTDAADVIYVEVTGGNLPDINRILQGLKHTSNYPNYKPHMTVAHVTPGTGALYADNDILNGTELEFNGLVFCDKDGGNTLIETNSYPYAEKRKAVGRKKGWKKTLIRAVEKSVGDSVAWVSGKQTVMGNVESETSNTLVVTITSTDRRGKLKEGDKVSVRSSEVQIIKEAGRVVEKDGDKEWEMRQQEQAQGGTCKVGERSDLTGCTPANGPAGKKPSKPKNKLPKPESDTDKKGTDEKPKKDKPKRAAPGSQLPDHVMNKLKELGNDKYPPAYVDVNSIKMADLSKSREELTHEPLMSWEQVSEKSGRKSKQYSYTPEFHHRNKMEKFDRVLKVEPHLDRVKEEFDKTISSPKSGQRDKEGAAIAAIILETGLRPTDGDDSVEAGHYGIGSLQARHVKIKGDTVHLDFTGKSGMRDETDVTNPVVVAMLKKSMEGKKGEDFVFPSATSSDAMKHLRSAMTCTDCPKDAKLKDMRTVKGTQTAREEVKKAKLPKLTGNQKKDEKIIANSILEISEKVSKVLCNTPTVARDSYVHPAIWDDWKKQILSQKK